METLKGRYVPKNPNKYAGDVNNIIYRSSYELKLFKWLDDKEDVIHWNSEELIITYISPVDGRIHRYFPDCIAKFKTKDGSIRTVVIEVKPKNQTVEPKVQKKKTKRYIYEVTTWAVNQSKWKAAEEFCLDRGWTFKILTEVELGIKR